MMRVPRRSAWAELANAEARASRGIRKELRRAGAVAPKGGSAKVRREHPRAGSRYELELQRLLAADGVAPPALQYKFAAHLGRQFRFDFAWPEKLLAVEVDGGRWLVRRGKDGRPVPVGYHNHVEDYRKLNMAARLGWRIMRFTPEMIRSGEALQEIRSWLVVPS